jgi:hypothetical protein
MQPHRSDLPVPMTLRATPASRRGSLRALGLSDALSVELQASQAGGSSTSPMNFARR